MSQTAAEIVKSKIGSFSPKVGIICGSGLGQLADQIEDPIRISYSDLPGFFMSSVQGHAGELIIGSLNGAPVACMKGRAHYYEGCDDESIRTMVRTFKNIGCEELLITNAAGSLREEVGPGGLMLINDHINFQFRNPLIGKNDESIGDRFFPMHEAYNPTMQDRLKEIAIQNKIEMSEGVYLSVLGPNFETPAEIRAFRTLGADAVGMSTVSEVITGVHCGLRIAAVSSITNYACGMSTTPITHDETLSNAAISAKNLKKIIFDYVGQYYGV